MVFVICLLMIDCSGLLDECVVLCTVNFACNLFRGCFDWFGYLLLMLYLSFVCCPRLLVVLLVTYLIMLVYDYMFEFDCCCLTLLVSILGDLFDFCGYFVCGVLLFGFECCLVGSIMVLFYCLCLGFIVNLSLIDGVIFRLCICLFRLFC